MSACPCCGFVAGKNTPDEIGKLIQMSAYERALFDALARRFGQEVQARYLADALYQLDPDGGPDAAYQCLAVFASRLRKKIEPFGLVIVGRGGRDGGGRMMIWSRDAR